MALVTIRRSPSVQTPRKTDEAEKSGEDIEDDVGSRVSKSLNECYFANKGAAVVLGAAERGCTQWRSPVRVLPQPDIQHHLQSMFYLLRPEETLKMAVKLESAHPGRTRYLVVVCRSDEAALLGIDCNERTTVGLVLRVLADTSIKLDGDGGFSVCVCNQQHIFKPVSVQAMWSALQTLHRASAVARAHNHFFGGTSHAWCAHYERHVSSDRSCLNEWHAMDCLESRRPPSPDSLRLKPRERDETERVIRCTLKEIMMSVDLDEVTSKAIRGRLEEELDMDLAEYKSFIDQEMLTILGQMDAPTEIFDHVYLGSEWNASNLEELQRNGVRHILNVTREIDNFFPGMFDYLNIRVYDDDKTDLLKHWDNTFKYINKAKNEGSKVLVHCKMGISRSASVVIAYAMKAFNWNFDKALKHVKAKRNCIKPNTNFLNQLETYQGILDAMKNKEKLQRSKSETNLKSPKNTSKTENKAMESIPLVLALSGSYSGRPRSWSPDSRPADLPPVPPTSVSLENLASETRHMLMPCANGSYSVSPNQIMRLKEEGAPSVRHRVHKIENAATADRKDSTRRSQRLMFGNAADAASADDKSSEAPAVLANPTDASGKPPQASPSKNLSHKYPQSDFEVDKIHTWDPGETAWAKGDDDPVVDDSDDLVKSDSGIVDVKANRVTVGDGGSREGRAGADGDDAPAPSRRSSCGSPDSALGLEPSRHPSWSRAPEPRAHRRALNERKFNETCAILRELAGAARLQRRDRGASTWGGRAAASAPAGAPADTWLRVGLRRRRATCASHGDLPRAAPEPAPAAPGRVSNLAKEFEARSEARRPPPAPAPDDVSVRSLVVRYDRPGGEARRRPDSVPKKCRLAPEGEAGAGAGAASEGRARSRNSYCGARGAPTVLPPVPLDYGDVVSAVVSKAQTKKQLQHGKTHPLTRLNLNRSNRCSNPVYNTM